MAPKLITMLTYNDETVQEAYEVFKQSADIPCEFWGFKDIGLPLNKMKKLVTEMKTAGKTTFLEIVSLSEKECLDGAKVAVDCQFDYLMGTVFYSSVFEYLKNKDIKFLPFCGKVSGHPSVVEGTIREVVEDGKKLALIGVDGVDLLAYRFVGDPEQLSREFISAVNLPVVIAGSIESFDRLDIIKDLNPWAFTIGTAFFDKKFVPGASFSEQIQVVLDYMKKTKIF
jgi:hypothetical protein